MQPDQVIQIISEKYGVEGRIEDYHGMVVKLKFEYQGKNHCIGISHGLSQTLADSGLKMMETTIERLSSESGTTALYYWYVERMSNGSMYAHGNVTGHPKFDDSDNIHTSRILSMEIDTEREEAILYTKNTVFHCPLSYCRFKNRIIFRMFYPTMKR